MSDLPRILFIDDEPKAGELFRRLAEPEGYACALFRDPAAGLAYFREAGADLVMTDLRMPEMDGIAVLRAIREQDLDVPVLVVTGYSTVDSAIDALRLGAADFIKKPYDPDELLVSVRRLLEQTRLRRENRLLRRQLADEWQRFGMVGKSPAIQRVYGLIEKVADIRCNVIIEGESGTGKELAARAIHNLGPDADRPFVVIDCGALTDTLLESELFGHERGAFTGADRPKQGLLEVASGGTVFLDEIGNISEAMQTKLLRVVQERQIVRVGGLRPVHIDVRFIAATNRGLRQLVAAGVFRSDLYHRLNVVTITLPPLRERHDDIPALVQHFVVELAQRYRREVTGFDPISLRRLTEHDWPGNVRELRNLVERHIALTDGPLLHLADPPGEGAPVGAIDADTPSLAELERRYILKTLDRHQGNRERTAQVLGINKSTLWRKLRTYGWAER
jgi:DNA-binding NtrC family response regulator